MMSIDVRVPTTGNAGEDAVILDWNVSVGTHVSAGDVLVTLETAKAVVEVEAPAGGEVLTILHQSGDEVPEHEVLAILGDDADKDAPADPENPQGGPASDPQDPGDAAPAEPFSGTTIISENADFDSDIDSDTDTDTDADSPADNAEHRSGGEERRVKASPRARVLADRNGIDLSTLTGSGPWGRIVIADVMDASRNTSASAVSKEPAATQPMPRDSAPAVARDAEKKPTTANAERPSAADDFEVVPVRGARKVTAQRMHASLTDSAQVTLTRYADATALMAYLARLRAFMATQGDIRLSVNDLVLFATARAVAKRPEANSIFDWDGIRRYRSVHLGFAVDTGQALLVPVIRRAESLSITDLALATRALIDAARAGKLGTADMAGGTFTVSNLGSLGVHWFTPVLNSPQSCILGVGAAHQTHPDAPTLLPLSLTFDHRALDGAAAATVLADIARSIEVVDVISAL